MYSNNILNFQESTTILNACTKSLETYWIHRVSIYLSIYQVRENIGAIAMIEYSFGPMLVTEPNEQKDSYLNDLFVFWDIFINLHIFHKLKFLHIN